MKEIQLSKQGKHRGKYVALVDDSDFEWLNKIRWSVNIRPRNVYAAAFIDGERVGMHRLILGLKNTEIEGDHLDHNGLNNQRYNLRISSQKQNRQYKRARKNSTSKFVGVSKVTYNNKKGTCSYWVAQIKSKGISTYLGSFKDETEAAKAYDKKAKELFGEYACLNFPLTQ